MEFSLEILRRSTAFAVVLALFAVANAWSWLRHKLMPVCCDQEVTVGFPIPFHISGGVAGTSNFYVLGLLLDITLALTIAVLATWIVRLLRQ